jgi:hypothetical protein
MTRAWLVLPGGAELAVGHGGLLLGRDPACDVVIGDPTVSRRHALVRCDDQGPLLTVLGRSGARVDGAPAAEAQRLTDGQVVEVGGSAYTVRAHAGSSAGWLVRPDTGPAIRLPPGESVVGEAFALPGWVAGALRWTEGPSGLTLRVGVAGVRRDGVPLEVGEEIALYGEDRVEGPGVPFTVARAGALVASTRVDAPLAEVPYDLVEVLFLARGGQLRLRRGAEEVRVWLAERRFALVTCLLQPQAGRPGDDVGDDEVIARVWPRQGNKSRVDVNVLVARVRKDLVEAGVARDLLSRSEGGGATRFRVGPSTEVRVG